MKYLLRVVIARGVVLHFTVETILKLSTEQTYQQNRLPVELEAVCLEVIKPKFKPILIVSVYRAPNTSIELFEKIEILFQNVENDRKEVIIVVIWIVI